MNSVNKGKKRKKIEEVVSSHTQLPFVEAYYCEIWGEGACAAEKTEQRDD